MEMILSRASEVKLDSLGRLHLAKERMEVGCEVDKHNTVAHVVEHHGPCAGILVSISKGNKVVAMECSEGIVLVVEIEGVGDVCVTSLTKGKGWQR